MLPLPRPLLTLIAAGGLLTLTAAPAAAHPSFADGASVPTSSLASVTLSMAHGCGTEAEGGGAPTLEVALEVPDAVSYIEADTVDGYQLEIEGDGPIPEVLIWTATGDGEPAPDLPLELVVEGDAGDEVYFRVFQGCEDFQYRWVGTPDEPADDPAVPLTLGAPDRDSPPPEPVEADTDAAGETTADGADGAVEGDDPEGDDPEEGDPEATEVEDLPTDPAVADDADDGGLGAVPIVLGALVLAALGALLVTKRRPADPAAHPGEPGPPPAA